MKIIFFVHSLGLFTTIIPNTDYSVYFPGEIHSRGFT